MPITLKIERISASDPSFSVSDDVDLEEEFDIDSARVMMDHGESSLVMDEPPIQFIIEDFNVDIEKKYYFLEWANCYWNDQQRQGGRLRKVTLNFYDETDVCYRSFVIENAFLAKYEEIFGRNRDIENQNVPRKYYKTIIRSNARTQNIDFLPRVKENEA